MEIRLCKVHEYPQLLDVLNEAFGYGSDSAWFQKKWSHCTPYPDIAAQDEVMKHFVCIIDEQIVGCVGAYPFDLEVCGENGTKRTIYAYGIGQVSCLNYYRNRGVMSALMKAAEEQMFADGRTIGFLGGNRRRYGYFGYDFGGNIVKYTPDKRLLADIASEKEVIIRLASFEDWHEMDKAYRSLPSFAHRSERKWKLHFLREEIRWYIGECCGQKGYIGFKEPNVVFELYGNPDTIAAMLLHMTNSQEEGKAISVLYAAQNIVSDAIGKMLYNTAAWVHSYPMGLSSIINPTKFLNDLQIDCAFMSANRQKSLARLLMGFEPLPYEKLNQAQVNHLCVWFSDIDSV